jgi:hypothetical protein
VIQGYVTSAVRTLSAYAVAWLLSLKLAGPVLAFLNVGTETAKERLTALLVFALGTVYYLIARLLEHRWPALGVLLGVPTKPTYAPITADGAHVVTSVKSATTGQILAVPVDDDGSTQAALDSWNAIHPSTD